MACLGGITLAGLSVRLLELTYWNNKSKLYVLNFSVSAFLHNFIPQNDNMHSLLKNIYTTIFIISLIVLLPLRAFCQKSRTDTIKMLLDSASVTYNNDKFKTSEAIIQSAEKVFKEMGYRRNQSKELDSLYFELKSLDAWVKTLCERFSEAEPMYLEIISQLPSDSYYQLSNTYMHLSSLYGMQKIYDKSREYALKALEYANLLNNDELKFHARSNLGDIYLYTKQYDKALAEYHEVRKLSIILHRYDAISLGNLAIAYHSKNMLDIAEQYYKEALRISEDNKSVVYSIILPEYCRLLLEKGDKIKARRLISEAIRDERNLQKSDYNLMFLRLLAETEDAYDPLIKAGLSAGGLLLLAVIILSVMCHRKSRSTAYYRKENGALTERVHGLEESISNGSAVHDGNTESHAGEALTHIALAESLPTIVNLVQQIKYSAGNKTDVVAKAKSLEQILAPFNNDKFRKNISLFLEQENGLGRCLKKEYPDLSVADIKLCILIREGLSTKDIAAYTNKSVRGVESAKFRLRKKMNITTQKDIYDCLLELEGTSEGTDA